MDKRFTGVRCKITGAQGRIRTSVARKERQIYSLLPLTTRPPVQFECRACAPDWLQPHIAFCPLPANQSQSLLRQVRRWNKLPHSENCFTEGILWSVISEELRYYAE